MANRTQGRLCKTCSHPERDTIERRMLMSAGRESLESLAGEFGISLSALSRHMTNHLPQALAEVATEVDKHARTVTATVALASSEARLAALQADYDLLEQVRTERAALEAQITARSAQTAENPLETAASSQSERLSKPLPGGSTGLLARKIKSLGINGVVEEYEIDDTLLTQRRHLLRQIEQETGHIIRLRGGAAAGGSNVNVSFVVAMPTRLAAGIGGPVEPIVVDARFSPSQTPNSPAENPGPSLDSIKAGEFDIPVDPELVTLDGPDSLEDTL